jgi:PHD/YefM family antitoxin component YafN of YafNO toxin-antitoxin module
VEAILADMTIGISEFKANPNKAVQDADGVPFCVLTNNAPAFYVVDPEQWERLQDILDDAALAPVIAKAIKKRKAAVKVALKDL